MSTSELKRAGSCASGGDVDVEIGGGIDGPGIVICDTSFPGMTGFDLYRQLVARDASGAPRFLFNSGEKTPTLT